VTASWDLKLDRAEHHLKKVRKMIRTFSDGHPYDAVRHDNVRINNQEVWRYVLRFTHQPDENLPIIVGDVIHNVRSALDHMAVAMVPNDRRRKAGFPIFSTCL